jgi:hypothetical protein
MRLPHLLEANVQHAARALASLPEECPLVPASFVVITTHNSRRSQ